jgi:hypothetical protein
MRALAKILRRIGGWLTWPAWRYGAPRPFAPWYYFGPWSLYYRFPTRLLAAAPRPGRLTPAKIAAYTTEHLCPDHVPAAVQQLAASH